jgi:hypothetical protein
MLQVLGVKCGLRVELSKKGILAPASAIDRTALEPKGHDLAHASSAREVHVVLVTIANLLVPWDFRAVTCDQAHTLRLSALRSSTPLTWQHTNFCL